MNPKLPEPERWCDLPARDTSAESAVGAVFRRVKQASEPSDAALARVTRQLEAPSPSRTARLAWRVAFAVLLVMATGGVVGAALNGWWRVGVVDAPRPAPARSVGGAPARASHHRRRAHGEANLAAASAIEANSEPAAEATAAPEIGPAPVAAALAPVSPSPPPGVAPAAPVASVGPVARAVRSNEGSELARVFRALRSGGDARAALRALDALDRRFPNGVHKTEARIARAEALLALDRRAEALPLLVGLEDGGDGLTPTVRVTRAELLSEARRCGEAVRDFDAVLAVSDGDATGARALYGRAACHRLAGDIPAARRDLQRYLSLHPNDRFAPAARRFLDSLP